MMPLRLTILRPCLRPRLWHAPFLLLLYQVAPVHAGLDESGRFRFAVGYGGGTYEDQQFDCDGNVTSRAKVNYTVAAASGEAWISPTTRVTVGGGLLGRSSDSAWMTVADGGFGGLLLAHEGRKTGYGGGIGFWPDADGGPTQALPSLYVRIGPLDKVHLRLEENATGTPGAMPGYRFGLARGFGMAWGSSWFLGLAAWPYPSSGNDAPAFTGEVRLPAGRRLQPFAGAAFRSNHGAGDWNLGVGVRVRPDGKR